MNRQEAIEVIRQLVEMIGNGFHPDHFMSDYVNGDNTPSFTDEECEKWEPQLSAAKQVLGDEVYDIGMSFFK